MRVCLDCQYCFDDSEVYCAEEGHSALSILRDGGPDIIPGYRLELFLGSDAKGENYCAYETASRGRCLISIRSTDETRSRQFLSEADLATAFCHPNVGDVYEAGYLDTGEVFVVAEDAEGETLRERMEREGVPRLLTTIQVIRQAAEALYALHMNGLKHGAINPQNILLTSDAQNRLLVRLRDLDFGDVLATSIVSSRSHIDRDLYPLRYFAPEQCSGAGATEKTDIYSLGIVLHEMLAGTAPFQASKAVGLIDQHRNQQPPEVRVDHYDLRMLVANTLMEALRKQPEMRQASANVFARQMRHMEQLVTRASVPPPVPVPVVTRKSQVVFAPPARMPSETDIQPVLVTPSLEMEYEVDTPLAVTSIEPDVVSPIQMSVPDVEPPLIPELPFEKPNVEILVAVEEVGSTGKRGRSRRKVLKRRLRSIATPTHEIHSTDEQIAEPPTVTQFVQAREPHRSRLKVLKKKLRSLVAPTTETLPIAEAIAQTPVVAETIVAKGPRRSRRKALKTRRRIMVQPADEKVIQDATPAEAIAQSAPPEVPVVEPVADVKPVRAKAKPKTIRDVKPAAPAMAAVASSRNIAPKIVRSKEPDIKPEAAAVQNAARVEAAQIAAVLTGSKREEPKKIVWEQPEDDIPSLEGVMETLAIETEVKSPIAQVAETKMAAPVLKQKEPRKVEWEQPEDDIPSLDDVMEALSAEPVAQSMKVEAAEPAPVSAVSVSVTEPKIFKCQELEDNKPSIQDGTETLSARPAVEAAEPTIEADQAVPKKMKCEHARGVDPEIPSAPMVLETCANESVPVREIAVIAAREEPKTIANERPKDVVEHQGKEPVAMIPIVEPKPQRVTPLPVSTTRFTIDLEAVEPQGLSLDDQPRRHQEAIFLPHAIKTARARTKNVGRDRRDPMFSAYARPSNNRHRMRIVGGTVAMLATAVFLGRIVVNEFTLTNPSEPAASTTTEVRTTVQEPARPAPILPVRPTTVADPKKLPPEQPVVIQAKLATKEVQSLAKDRSRNTAAVSADINSRTLVSQNIRSALPPASTLVITYGSGKVTSRVEPPKGSNGKGPIIPLGKKGEESTRPRIVRNPRN